MEESRKVVQTAVGILLLLIVAAALFYFLVYKKAGPTPEPQEMLAPPVTAEEPALVEEKQLPSIPPVELDRSDDLVRQLAKELSSHPKVELWLKSRDLIRRFTAAVDNIANGLSPSPHIDFFVPEGDFRVIKRGDFFYADPDGYSRYDAVVDVFISLDSRKSVQLFRSLKPVFQEAYRDLGYPNQDFEDTLFRAMDELLRTPVVEGDIRLEKAVLNYLMADPVLEGLSDAQKHLLRMGPENVGAVQAKLREMAAALGIPESRLPRQRPYRPST
ncbi:MAG: DUF3014 domain-containing protein [Candidatus Aminicenantes bacterium]|nr:DUF3014 domain-containing protein [Candidatus Aminicenantes bacterium]